MDFYSPRYREQDVKKVLALVFERSRNCVRSSEVPIWKHVLDVGCILFALPALVPLGLIIAFWIKISSPGPILFRQERVGLRGRRFICLKFRSMRVGADTKAHKDYLKQLMQSNAPMTKMDLKGDSRLIPL